MKTYKELLAKWGDGVERETFTREQEKEYVEDWYKIGRNIPTKPFENLFSDYAKYDGQTFEIVGEVNEGEDGVTLEQLPMWKLKMDDGQVVWGLCDEIFNFEADEFRYQWGVLVNKVLTQGRMVAFEIFNTELQEHEYHNIQADFDKCTLNWGDYSVEYDTDFDIDANLENLYETIMQSGKYE